MTRDEVTTAESQATHNCHDEITTKSRQSHNSGGHNSGGHNSGGHNSGHNSGHNREESEVTYEDSTSEVQPPPPPPTPPPPPLTPTMKRATTPRLSVVSVEAGGIGTISKTDDKSDKQCCFSCSKLSAFFSAAAADDDFPESEISNLRRRLKRQKIRIGAWVLCTVAVEVALGALSLNSRMTSRRMATAAKRRGEEMERSFNSYIDSGLIEVILFAIPFMLVTNLLVLAAMWRNNVWFLLPWMVLHCIVIAFLALGAAILTAHDRALLGWVALIAAVFFLLCWKSIRVLFMKMVDWEVAKADFGGGGGKTEIGTEFKGSRDFSKAGNGGITSQREGAFGKEDEDQAAADDESSTAYKEWNEEIFFGSKDRKFTRTISSAQSREQRIGGGSTFF